MYRSQFMPQADAIGSVKFFPFMGSVMITPDGQEWLKTGLAKDKINYPVAAATPSCQVVGNAAPTYIGGDILSSATNGTGTIVIVPTSGGGTNLWVSTNYGATWATVAHNLGQTAKSVAYNGTTWVVVANTAVNLVVSTSTNPASTWTLAGNVLSIQGGGAAADTASICWDSTNSRFIAVTAGGSATNAAGYSSNGTSWTGVNLSSALGGTTSIAVNGGTILACCYSGSVVNKSVNGGTSWTTAANSGTNYSNIVAASGKFFRTSSTTAIYYTTDGVAWTSGALSEAGVNTNTDKQTLVSDGTTVFFNSGASKIVGSTTDGVSFVYKGANFNQGGGTSIACGGTNKIFCYGASTTNMYTQNYNTCDYVGSVTSIYHSNTTYSYQQLVAYIRIK